MKILLSFASSIFAQNCVRYFVPGIKTTDDCRAVCDLSDVCHCYSLEKSYGNCIFKNSDYTDGCIETLTCREADAHFDSECFYNGPEDGPIKPGWIGVWENTYITEGDIPKFEDISAIDSNLFAEYIAVPVDSVGKCFEICRLSTSCSCYSFLKTGDMETGQCFFKEQILEDPEKGFEEGNYIDGADFIENDARFMSGCVDFQEPTIGRITGGDVFCSLTSRPSDVFEKLITYLDWMFSHNVTYQEMVDWALNYFKNVANDRVFLIAAYSTKDGANAMVTKNCSLNPDGKCFRQISPDESQEFLVIDVEMKKTEASPDWRDIMWKMRSSDEHFAGENGLRVDPGCESSPFFNSYYETIREKSTVYSAISWCGSSIENHMSEFAIGFTPNYYTISPYINYDRESANFQTVSFSTCCWSLFVSP